MEDLALRLRIVQHMTGGRRHHKHDEETRGLRASLLLGHYNEVLVQRTRTNTSRVHKRC